jgi:hypothetical protein
MVAGTGWVSDLVVVIRMFLLDRRKATKQMNRSLQVEVVKYK